MIVGISSLKIIQSTEFQNYGSQFTLHLIHLNNSPYSSVWYSTIGERMHHRKRTQDRRRDEEDEEIERHPTGDQLNEVRSIGGQPLAGRRSELR